MFTIQFTEGYSYSSKILMKIKYLPSMNLFSSLSCCEFGVYLSCTPFGRSCRQSLIWNRWFIVVKLNNIDTLSISYFKSICPNIWIFYWHTCKFQFYNRQTFQTLMVDSSWYQYDHQFNRYCSEAASSLFSYLFSY